MTVDTRDLTLLDDRQLIDYTESVIHESAFWAGRRNYTGDAHDRCDAAYEECQRRTPNGHLYTIAWNRAAQGVCGPNPVPPDPRRVGDD
jgi:hypothetical protein